MDSALFPGQFPKEKSDDWHHSFEFYLIAGISICNVRKLCWLQPFCVFRRAS